jgi:hypothetical protein
VEMLLVGSTGCIWRVWHLLPLFLIAGLFCKRILSLLVLFGCDFICKAGRKLVSRLLPKHVKGEGEPKSGIFGACMLPESYS